MKSVARLATVEELRNHVLKVLCEKDNLDPQQTPLHQSVITRKGKPCGLFFQAQGPRLMKTYALWAGEENRILFYQCNGERFAQTNLSEAPNPSDLIEPTTDPAEAA